jgi:hypothetical protein
MLLPAKLLTSIHVLSHFPAPSKTALSHVCFGLPLFLDPCGFRSYILAWMPKGNSESKIFMTLFQINTFCNILKIFNTIFSLLTYNRTTKNNVADRWATTAQNMKPTALYERTFGRGHGELVCFSDWLSQYTRLRASYTDADSRGI